MKRFLWIPIAALLLVCFPKSDHLHSVVSAQVSCPAGQAVTAQTLNTGQTCTAFASTPGVVFSYNGTVKPLVYCPIFTGTSSSTGVATISLASVSPTPTAILTVQPSVTSSGVATIQVSSTPTTSAVTLATQAGTTLSIAGINVVSLSSASLPYSVIVCYV